MPVARTRARAAKGRRSWSPFRLLSSGESGVAIVDFALVAPFLVFLFMGGVEISRFALLNQKLSRVATNASDLVSQSEFLTEDDMEQVFIATQFSLQPFALGDDGVVILSSVSTEDEPTDPRVNWQRSGGGTGSFSSRVGSPGGPADLPFGYEMKANRNIIVSEVYFDFEPLFFGGVTSPKELAHFAIYRPRLGALTEILP
ncbi:MAG: pilus assembly protein [Kiloniellales bacterium]|nr:pilus assembly protein [Kiloniellales bacterium]